MPGASVEVVDGVSTDLLRLIRFEVRPEGGAVRSRGIVGARRVGEVIYLCATLPGATEPELVAAQDICARLGE